MTERPSDSHRSHELDTPGLWPPGCNLLQFQRERFQFSEDCLRLLAVFTIRVVATWVREDDTIASDAFVTITGTQRSPSSVTEHEFRQLGSIDQNDPAIKPIGIVLCVSGERRRRDEDTLLRLAPIESTDELLNLRSAPGGVVVLVPCIGANHDQHAGRIHRTERWSRASLYMTAVESCPAP
jgi:hypothetical protein